MKMKETFTGAVASEPVIADSAFSDYEHAFEIGGKRYRRGLSNLGTVEWSIVSTSYPAWVGAVAVPYTPRLAVMPDDE